jgi:hypothetical protein
MGKRNFIDSSNAKRRVGARLSSGHPTTPGRRTAPVKNEKRIFAEIADPGAIILPA